MKLEDMMIIIMQHQLYQHVTVVLMSILKTQALTPAAVRILTMMKLIKLQPLAIFGGELMNISFYHKIQRMSHCMVMKQHFLMT